MHMPEIKQSINDRIQKLSRDENAGIILVFSALVLGILVRLIHVANADFPINDGGLFYAMIRDLQANRFLIPAVTSYNNSALPFAYPPLGFFLAGGLNSVFGWDLLEQMRWLPFIFNLFCIPVFYFFSRRLLKDAVKAGIATLIFALLRPGYEWLIMGGGLTRSPAMLFSLLSLTFYLAMLEAPRRRVRDILLTAAALSLTILSHLEFGWFTVYSFALLWVFRGRSRQNLVSSIYILLATIVLTSPFWGQVVAHNQLSPFLAGLKSGGYSPLQGLFELFYFNFTEELIFPVLASLALLGVILVLIKREYLLPVWLVLNAFLDARSVNRSDVIPAAMLISIGIVDGVFGLIAKYHQKKNGQEKSDEPRAIIFTRSGILLLFLLCMQVALTAYFFRPTDPSLTHIVSRGDRDAIQWVKTNTAQDAKFLVLPSATWWGVDAVGEWFPALSGRASLLTVQGSEWLPNYHQRLSDYDEIYKAINYGALDIETLKQKFPAATYLYLPLRQYRDTTNLIFLHSLLRDFPLVFKNNDVEIYQLRGF